MQICGTRSRSQTIFWPRTTGTHTRRNLYAYYSGQRSKYLYNPYALVSLFLLWCTPTMPLSTRHMHSTDCRMSCRLHQFCGWKHQKSKSSFDVIFWRETRNRKHNYCQFLWHGTHAKHTQIERGDPISAISDRICNNKRKQRFTKNTDWIGHDGIDGGSSDLWNPRRHINQRSVIICFPGNKSGRPPRDPFISVIYPVLASRWQIIA